MPVRFSLISQLEKGAITNSKYSWRDMSPYMGSSAWAWGGSQLIEGNEEKAWSGRNFP